MDRECASASVPKDKLVNVRRLDFDLFGRAIQNVSVAGFNFPNGNYHALLQIGNYDLALGIGVPDTVARADSASVAVRDEERDAAERLPVRAFDILFDHEGGQRLVVDNEFVPGPCCACRADCRLRRSVHADHNGPQRAVQGMICGDEGIDFVGLFERLRIDADDGVQPRLKRLEPLQVVFAQLARCQRAVEIRGVNVRHRQFGKVEITHDRSTALEWQHGREHEDES